MKIVSSTDLKIWDTPAPPNLEECLVSPPSRRPPRLLKTVETRYSTGITFLLSGNLTVAIHAHTSKSPCASKTFERLSYRTRGPIVWLYVPLSSEDGITAFGTRLKWESQGRYSRGTPCFLVGSNGLRVDRSKLTDKFRFARSGDLAIGPRHDEDTTDFVSATSIGCTLIYSIPEMVISDIGVCPKMGENVQITPFTPVGDPPFKYAFFSSGSLEAVFSTTVFYEKESQFCKGIIIKYHNGTRRALGQCRLGVDPTQYCTAPSHLCHSPITHYRPDAKFPRHGVSVEFTTEPKLQHNEEATRDWECYRMKGILQFWFNSSQTALQVVD